MTVPVMVARSVPVVLLFGKARFASQLSTGTVELHMTGTVMLRGR